MLIKPALCMSIFIKHWKPIERDLTCKFQHTQPIPSPAFPSNNLQFFLLHLPLIYNCFAFLVLRLFQNLACREWHFSNYWQSYQHRKRGFFKLSKILSENASNFIQWGKSWKPGTPPQAPRKSFSLNVTHRCTFWNNFAPSVFGAKILQIIQKNYCKPKYWFFLINCINRRILEMGDLKTL